MMDIKEAVATRIASSGQVIADRIIDALVEETLDKRVKQVMAAYTEHDKLKKEMYKIKPDVLSFNEDGSPATSAYSKNKLEERKKVTERLDKVQKALDAALDENNYEPLNKLGGDNGKPGVDPRSLENSSGS